GQIGSTEYVALATQTGTADDVITSTLAAGVYDLWVAPVGAVATNYTLTLQAGGTYVPPPPPPGTGSVSGKLWQDTNGNGILDGAEGGLSGWTVYADLTTTNQPYGNDVIAAPDS